MGRNTNFKRTVFAHAMLLAVTATMSTGVTAQDAGAKLQRVEVTGSAVRRIDAEAALSIQVLTKEEITRSGVTSTEQLLQTISALSSAGGTQSSEGAGLSTYGNATISLRGLEDARTLVLVNGRRLATFASGSAGVNVNVIPLSAIERVEVLKDGASSIYGSDAMAGVVNFILVRTFDGVEVGLTAGSPTTAGGGQNGKFTLTAGVGGDENSAFKGVVSASFEKEKALYGRERSYSKTSLNAPYYVGTATGSGNIEGGVIPGAYPNDRITTPAFGASPGTGYGNPNAVSGTCAAINMFDAGLTNKGAPYCQYDSAGPVNLVPQRELANFSGNFAFKLSDKVELFADALYSRSTVIQTYQPSPLRRSFAETDSRLAAEGIDPSLIIYPSNPHYPTAHLTKYAPGLLGKPVAVTARPEDFGGRQTTDVAIQTRVVAGVKGIVAGQDYEVALMSNVSKLEGKYTGGYFSIGDYNKIINDPSNNWNPWAPGGVQSGPLATKLKAAEYKGPSLDGTSKNVGFDAKLAGELFSMPAGPAQYAVGLQSREDSISRTPAEKPGTGDISGAGGAAFAIDKSRTMNGIFAELNVPVIKSLEANVSARTDRYSDFGTANTYKVSGRWQPVPEVLVRSSYNTGFRAPTLTELYQPQILGSTEQFNDPATGQTDLQVNGLTGGNPNLRPEKSNARSFGLVLSPVKNFSIGFDWFNIQVTDIIQTPSAQLVVTKFRAGDPAFQGLVRLNGTDVDSVTTLTSNLGTADVVGMDVFANYRANFALGRLDLGMNGTLMNKFDQASPSGTISKKVGTTVENDGTPVLGADTGGVILKWKHTLAATWTQGDFATTFTQNFSDSYRVGNDLNDNPVYVAAQSIYDLNLAYRGIKKATLMLGVKNVFDTQPGTFVPVSNQFQNGYDVSQYNPRGRYVYVTGSYRF
ncbi:MAG: TonB-dependent receptor [Pseudomonadota bacterium]